ncbi:unnamed protein product [Closterium sp. NIES-53]
MSQLASVRWSLRLVLSPVATPRLSPPHRRHCRYHSLRRGLHGQFTAHGAAKRLNAVARSDASISNSRYGSSSSGGGGDAGSSSMALEFEVLATHGRARAARMTLPHHSCLTPMFMPVGTQGTIKGLTAQQLGELGCQVMDGAGGLHAFMDWPRGLLTDSGGFQMVSLLHLADITEQGVEFQSPVDGTRMLLTPEESIAIQNKIGADIIMALDDVVSSLVSGPRIEEATHRTLRWMDRCMQAHSRPHDQNLFGIVQGGLDPKLRQYCCQHSTSSSPSLLFPLSLRFLHQKYEIQFWGDFGIDLTTLPSPATPLPLSIVCSLLLPLPSSSLHCLLPAAASTIFLSPLSAPCCCLYHLPLSIVCSLLPPLSLPPLDACRDICLKGLIDRDLPGYAIGGLAGGEDKESFWRVVAQCTAALPANKPRYVMGVGYPLDIVVCSALGADMYDCVYPTRTARFGTALIPEGVLKLKHAAMVNDHRPIDPSCSCLVRPLLPCRLGLPCCLLLSSCESALFSSRPPHHIPLHHATSLCTPPGMPQLLTSLPALAGDQGPRGLPPPHLRRLTFNLPPTASTPDCIPHTPLHPTSSLCTPPGMPQLLTGLSALAGDQGPSGLPPAHHPQHRLHDAAFKVNA